MHVVYYLLSPLFRDFNVGAKSGVDGGVVLIHKHYKLLFTDLSIQYAITTCVRSLRVPLHVGFLATR